MFVWRVQNVDGYGPYSVEHKYCDAVKKAHDDVLKHPVPCMDGIPEFDTLELKGLLDDRWVCGFDSLEKLQVWFEGWLDKLVSVGFLIYQFEVAENSLYKGQRQILFLKEEAKLITDNPDEKEV